MGWYELPTEKEAPKRAKAAIKRMGAGSDEQLLLQWRELAEKVCRHCSKPIGWGARYYLIDHDGISHGLCLELAFEQEVESIEES